MAIDLATGFNIGSKDVIDERQILTLEQMKNLDESIYPDKYFAISKCPSFEIKQQNNQLSGLSYASRLFSTSNIGRIL